jgi:hypothetical protein
MVVRYLLEKLAKGGRGCGFVVVRGAEVDVGAKDLFLGHATALLLLEGPEEPVLLVVDESSRLSEVG